jgi:hypothetical protein
VILLGCNIYYYTQGIYKEDRTPKQKPTDKHTSGKELDSFVPGFYADRQGRLYFRMAEFLAAHSMPDTPEFRSVIWDEIRDIFHVEVIEIED